MRIGLAMISAAVGAGLIAATGAAAQLGANFGTAGEASAALAHAREQAREAGLRASRLESEARSTRAAAERTAREAAALAARIQQAEAGIAAAHARIAITRSQRAAIDRRLAERREPLLRLTAGLQKLARRPVALSVLRPGSLRETVYLRAMLESTLPEVRRRTGALRVELAQAEVAEAEAQAALASLRSVEQLRANRQRRLAGLEARQRLASRQAGDAAIREAERALAMAEQARDLDGLVGQLDSAGALRAQLAALPGPLLRPAAPGASEVTPLASPATTAPGRLALQLPVAGRTIVGFGNVVDGVRSEGISLAATPRAQVVAPAAGRVAFAGPFRGFDSIVIIEHRGGYASLVTGLARVDVAVGRELVAGAPLGQAAPGRALVGFELRRGGVPVNPAEYLR